MNQLPTSDLMRKLEDLLTIARRTETRLVALAKHVGAEHIGAPNKPKEQQ